MSNDDHRWICLSFFSRANLPSPVRNTITSSCICNEYLLSVNLFTITLGFCETKKKIRASRCLLTYNSFVTQAKVFALSNLFCIEVSFSSYRVLRLESLSVPINLSISPSSSSPAVLRRFRANTFSRKIPVHKYFPRADRWPPRPVISPCMREHFASSVR